MIYDVIIIGGGLSGLRAAHLLTKEKKKVMIMEANDRLGGRVRSQKFKSTYPDSDTVFVELGAELIHGNKSSARKLIEEIGAPYIKVYTWAQGDGGPSTSHINGKCGYYWLGKENKWLRYDSDDEDFITMNEAIQEICEVDVTEHDVTLREYFERRIPKRMKSLAEAGYANTVNNTLDVTVKDIQITEELWEIDGKGEFVVLSGLENTIVPYLTSSPLLTVSLNTVARNVKWKNTKDDCVEVHTIRDMGHVRKHIYRARQVVVAVPVSMLQNKCLSFEPSLPQIQQRAMERITMEPAMKIIVELETSLRHYLPNDLAGVICSDSVIPEFWLKQNTNRFILVGFVAATHAHRLSSFPEKEQRQLIYMQLSAMLDVKLKIIKQNVIRFERQNWGEETYIRGGYTSPSGVDRSVTCKPLDNKIFFVGEYAQPNHGTMNAALASAEEAVKRMKSQPLLTSHL